jgi:uncharacterized protein YqgV (UPF0045/DUF77 family)
MTIVDFAMVPMGSGTSATKYIRAIYSLPSKMGMTFVPDPMSTLIETNSFEELLDIIRKANERLEEMGVKSITTSIGIDYRLEAVFNNVFNSYATANEGKGSSNAGRCKI